MACLHSCCDFLCQVSVHSPYISFLVPRVSCSIWCFHLQASPSTTSNSWRSQWSQLRRACWRCGARTLFLFAPRPPLRFYFAFWIGHRWGVTYAKYCGTCTYFLATRRSWGKLENIFGRIHRVLANVRTTPALLSINVSKTRWYHPWSDNLHQWA